MYIHVNWSSIGVSAVSPHEKKLGQLKEEVTKAVFYNSTPEEAGNEKHDIFPYASAWVILKWLFEPRC